jgi:hypothetical protein
MTGEADFERGRRDGVSRVERLLDAEGEGESCFSGIVSLCYDGPMLEPYEIRIRKEMLKSATSRMTVFPDGSKEDAQEFESEIILSVAVYIEETPGQGAAFERVTSP